jgi:hypothetical protein
LDEPVAMHRHITGADKCILMQPEREQNSGY